MAQAQLGSRDHPSDDVVVAALSIVHTRPMFFLATVPAGMYWLTMSLAQLFPGTTWADPEFQKALAAWRLSP